MFLCGDKAYIVTQQRQTKRQMNVLWYAAFCDVYLQLLLFGNRSIIREELFMNGDAVVLKSITE